MFTHFLQAFPLLTWSSGFCRNSKLTHLLQDSLGMQHGIGLLMDELSVDQQSLGPHPHGSEGTVIILVILARNNHQWTYVNQHNAITQSFFH